MAKSNKKTRLMHRDQRILRCAALYGMVTFKVLLRRYFHDQHPDAVKSTLRRLCGRGPHYRFLQPEPLDVRRVYYRLTPRGAKKLGVSKNLAKAWGPQARIRRYALLWLMCLEPTAKRQPFLLSDFPEQFKDVASRLPRNQFFIEASQAGDTTLGFAVIDHGRNLRRAVRSTVQKLARYLEQQWLDDFLAAKAFGLTVLAPTAGRCEAFSLRLEKEIRRELEPQLSRFGFRPRGELPLSIRPFVVPGMLPLLPDPQDIPESDS